MATVAAQRIIIAGPMQWQLMVAVIVAVQRVINIPASKLNVVVIVVAACIIIVAV